MASSNPTVLVTGATGAQGGSVARHLLRQGEFRVRALTRNPSSPAARALADAGAEVVQGDLGDRETLRRALDGCWGVFGVTSFWEHFAAEKQHGINLIDSVADSSVECFIFSTLASAHRASGGKLEVPHLDIKAELEQYAREKNLPAIYTHVAFYYENFLSFFPPQKQADGTYAFGFPQGDTKLAAYAVEDTGGVIAALFRNPASYRGQVVGVVGDDQPCSHYASVLTQVLGVTVRYNHIPREVYAGFGFPGAEELANMFEYNRLHVPSRQKDLELCRRLYPQMQTFEQWAKGHVPQLKQAMGL